jgi:GNAT superfamily N-acetyltransferase
MSLLFGSSENNIFNAKLANYLLNNNSRATYEYLQVYPSLWNKKIKELLGNKIAKPGMSKSNEVITKLERVNFTFNNEKYKPTLKIKSADFVFVKTDEVLFNEIKGTVVPYLFWRNANQFIQHSIGFTLLKNDAPISTAYAAFIHNPYLEIGIETNPKYQGMGLAQWVCSALINYSLKNSFEPVWACRADNVGSCKLAQKLGFEPIKTLPYYQLPKHI